MPDGTTAASTRNEDALRAEGERIERLLEELRGVAGPQTWPRIDELVQRLVGLYGVGLAKLLAHAQAAVGPAELKQRVCADELLSSLLLVHGLHPEPVETRVRRAIEIVQPALGKHAIEVASLRDGQLVLRTMKPCDGCGTSHVAVEQYVRTALEEAAPELNAIHLEGLAPDRPKTKLVPLGVPRAGDAS